MKYVPNTLSLSRLGFAAVVLVAAVQGHWSLAFVMLIVGASTDLLDGYYARKFDAETKLGRDLLQPLGAMALTVGAVLGLLIRGVWPWWAGGVLLALSVIFQLISWTAERSDFMRRLKRHQYYLHPFMNVFVLLAAIDSYMGVMLMYNPRLNWAMYVVYLGVIMVLAYYKRDWIREHLEGPQRD